MKQTSTYTGRSLSVPAGLLFGTGISISVTVLGAVVVAYLLEHETVKWESVGYGVLFVLLLASFLGAKASWMKIKRQRMMISLMSGILFYAVLLSMTALFFGGQYESAGVTLVLVIAGSCTAGILGNVANREGSAGKIRNSVVKLCK